MLDRVQAKSAARQADANANLIEQPEVDGANPIVPEGQRGEEQTDTAVVHTTNMEKRVQVETLVSSIETVERAFADLESVLREIEPDLLASNGNGAQAARARSAASSVLRMLAEGVLPAAITRARTSGDGQSAKSQAVKVMRAVILREPTASREVQVALARCLIHIDGSVSEIPEDLLEEAR